MKKVIAKHLRKGDLIYYEDSYFVVVSDKRYRDYSRATPYVCIRCYMSPTNTISLTSLGSISSSLTNIIGACKYIKVTETVWLLHSLGS